MSIKTRLERLEAEAPVPVAPLLIVDLEGHSFTAQRDKVKGSPGRLFEVVEIGGINILEDI